MKVFKNKLNIKTTRDQLLQLFYPLWLRQNVSYFSLFILIIIFVGCLRHDFEDLSMILMLSLLMCNESKSVWI